MWCLATPDLHILYSLESSTGSVGEQIVTFFLSIKKAGMSETTSKKRVN